MLGRLIILLVIIPPNHAACGSTRHPAGPAVVASPAIVGTTSVVGAPSVANPAVHTPVNYRGASIHSTTNGNISFGTPWS